MMKQALLVAVGVSATIASAQRFDMFVYENSSGTDTSGLDLYFEVFDVGGTAIDFVFHNDSTQGSVVTSVYFEDALLGLIDGRIAAESSGVDFEDGSSPSSPGGQPGDAFGGPWQGVLYGAGAIEPPPFNGINEGVGETLTIRFDLDGIGFGDVVDALSSDPRGLRIAQHVQGIGDNAKHSVWTVNVPAPATLALLGVASLGRRRR